MKMSSKTLIIAHGDLDGITSAVLLAEQIGIETEDLNIVFTQPFLVDQIVIPDEINQVYVVDIAINNRDPKMTADFVRYLGGKLVRWYDHHQGWDDYFADSRFTTTPTQACAERIGNSHDIRVQDAVASDTREGAFSPTGLLIEHATKAYMGNDDIRLAAVKLLMGNESQRPALETAAKKYAAIQNETEWLAGYGRKVSENVWMLNVPNTYHQIYGYDGSFKEHDQTQLLLAGQKLAKFAVVVTKAPKSDEEMVTIATKSDTNLIELFGLESGAKFRVTLPISRLGEIMEQLEAV